MPRMLDAEALQETAAELRAQAVWGTEDYPVIRLLELILTVLLDIRETLRRSGEA